MRGLRFPQLALAFALCFLPSVSGCGVVNPAADAPNGTRATRCTGNQLSGSLPTRSGTIAVVMQGELFSVWLRNSGATCWLRGYPTLSLWSGHEQLSFHQDNSPSAGGKFRVRKLTLARGGVAAVFIWVGRGSGVGTCSSFIDVRIGRSGTPIRVATAHVRVCPAEYPSHQLLVSPYHPASIRVFGSWPPT